MVVNLYLKLGVPVLEPKVILRLSQDLLRVARTLLSKHGRAKNLCQDPAKGDFMRPILWSHVLRPRKETRVSKSLGFLSFCAASVEPVAKSKGKAT